MNINHDINAAPFEIEYMAFKSQDPMQDVVARPWTLNATNDVINSIKERTNDGKNITTTSIEQDAAKLFTTKADAESIRQVNIENGLSSRRYTFFAVIRSNSSSLLIERTMIFGYTDSPDIIFSNNIAKFDDNMLLFINSMYTLKSKTYMDQRSGRVVESNTPMVNNHIRLAPSAVRDAPLNDQNIVAYTLTPRSIAWSAHNASLERNFEELQNNGNGGTTYTYHRPGNDSATTLVDNTGKIENRNYTLPANTLSELLRGAAKGVAESKREEQLISKGGGFGFNDASQSDPIDIATGTGDTKVWNEALNWISQRSPLAGTLDRLMSRIQSTGTYSLYGYISIGTFNTLVGNINNYGDDRVIVIDAPPTSFGLDAASNRAHTVEASIATQLSSMVTTAMVDTGIGYVQFKLTNHTSNRLPFFTLSDTGHDGSRYPVSPLSAKNTRGTSPWETFNLEEFKLLMETHVHFALEGSIGSGGDYELFVSASLTGDVHITIRYLSMGNDIYRFTFPAFCDGLYSPMLTGRSSDINSMASEITNLVGQVFETPLQPANYYQSGVLPKHGQTSGGVHAPPPQPAYVPPVHTETHPGTMHSNAQPTYTPPPQQPATQPTYVPPTNKPNTKIDFGFE